MSLGGIAGFLLLLAAVFLFGNLWFHGVEALVRRVRRLVSRPEQGAWHPLPPEERREERD